MHNTAKFAKQLFSGIDLLLLLSPDMPEARRKILEAAAIELREEANGEPIGKELSELFSWIA